MKTVSKMEWLAMSRTVRANRFFTALYREGNEAIASFPRPSSGSPLHAVVSDGRVLWLGNDLPGLHGVKYDREMAASYCFTADMVPVLADGDITAETLGGWLRDNMQSVDEQQRKIIERVRNAIR